MDKSTENQDVRQKSDHPFFAVSGKNEIASMNKLPSKFTAR